MPTLKLPALRPNHLAFAVALACAVSARSAHAQYSLAQEYEKGFSVLRHFQRETDNDYEGGHLDFEVKLSETLNLEFGYSRREYKFKTNQGQRLSNEQINPTLQELGLTASDLGRVYDFGDGLDVPAGAPSAFFAPDIKKFQDAIGFDCNCLNEYGDFLSDMASGLIGSIGTGASGNYSFTDDDKVDIAMFDPAGGTAPDIAGQNKCNPTAILLAFGS